MRQPESGCCLAIGACHCQHINLSTGVIKPLISNQSRRSFEPGEGGNFVALQIKGFNTFGFHQHGGSALRQCLGDISAAICCCAGPGDESITCLNLAAIGLQIALHAAAQPGHGLGCVVQCLNLGAHSTGSSGGPATI